MDNHGFMGFWSDIDADYRLTYQEWHNCEHIPERVGIPGFVEGRRYRAVADGPMFFMCYVTRDLDVLGSEAYLAALNRPTPWTKEALTHFRNPERSIYRRVTMVGSMPTYAPYIVLVRFNDPRPGAEIAAQLDGWMATAPVADLRAALYDMDTATSTIMTAERRIYSAGPGERQYLIAVELLEKGPADGLAESLRGLLSPHAANLDAAVYWLETRIRAADVRKGDPAEQLGERKDTP